MNSEFWFKNTVSGVSMRADPGTELYKQLLADQNWKRVGGPGQDVVIEQAPGAAVPGPELKKEGQADGSTANNGSLDRSGAEANKRPRSS